MTKMTSRAAAAHREATAATKRRAAWVMGHWEDRPSIGYAEMLADVRAHFGCGKTAGEQAIARANEIRREQFMDPYVIDRMAAKVLEIAEDAHSKGKHRDAIYGIEAAMRMRGLAAPEKVDVTEKVDPGVEEAELEDLSDEQLALFAALNRKKRT